jgi:hypothetical protein
MKKLIVIVSVAMFYIAGFAATPNSSWIVSDEGRISCEKINIGVSKARIVLENGEKITVPLEKISSYSLNGMVFDKKMLYIDGKPTGQTSFMQLIKSRNGFSLYKNVAFDPESIDPLKEYYSFYVYADDKFHLALDEKLLPSVFHFFNVKWSYN